MSKLNGDLLPKLTADEILALIKARHTNDVFVSQCKDGPTWTTAHCRMDAWAMKRSWTNPLVTAYEVKISRGDFLQDDKWPAYLPCCNLLNFVCPSGVIQPSEVGESVGLLWVASTGRALVMKKKAVFRDVTIPEPVWRYIVMSRARIVPPNYHEPQSGAAYWREWLSQRDEERRLGYQVSQKIAKYVEEIERRIVKLEAKHKEYDDLRVFLGELGWKEPDKEWLSRHVVGNRLDRLRGVIPPYFTRMLEDVEKAASRMRTAIADELRPAPSP